MIRNLIEDTPDGKYYFTYHHSAGDSMSMMATTGLLLREGQGFQAMRRMLQAGTGLSRVPQR